VPATPADQAGGLSVRSRLNSAQVLNYGRDATDLCDDAGKVIATYDIPEEKRINIAFECVWTLSLAFDGSERDARLPKRLLSTFQTNLAALQKYGDEGKLTSEQSDMLNKARVLAEGLGQR
jgi:hypothetical protein